MVVGVSIFLFPGSGISWCTFPSFSLKANKICFFPENLIHLDLHICFDWGGKEAATSYDIVKPIEYIINLQVGQISMRPWLIIGKSFVVFCFGDALLLGFQCFFCLLEKIHDWDS